MSNKSIYLWLMGTCAVLILLAWNVVLPWSRPLALVMSLIALPLPPIAVFLANRGQD